MCMPARLRSPACTAFVWIFKTYFLFQRTPLLVSSRMIPCSRRPSRMRSERAKSRFFLAAVRSATRASISESESSPALVLGLRTSKMESNWPRKARAAGALPARNSPESMALLASRTNSKTAARASAVLRSSLRLAVNASEASAGRAASCSDLELARIHGTIGIAHELEDGRQGFGGVEIVVEAGGERLRGLGGARGQLFVAPFGAVVGLQAQFEVTQPVDGNGGRFQAVDGEVERFAVGHRRQQVADGLGRMPLADQVAEGIVVAQRLGHLLPLHHEELGVEPEARKQLAGERFRLRDLVFVVGENQVHTAGVDIEGLPQ